MSKLSELIKKPLPILTLSIKKENLTVIGIGITWRFCHWCHWNGFRKNMGWFSMESEVCLEFLETKYIVLHCICSFLVKYLAFMWQEIGTATDIWEKGTIEFLTICLRAEFKSLDIKTLIEHVASQSKDQERICILFRTSSYYFLNYYLFLKSRFWYSIGS